RTGKIKGTLLGRAWYVDHDALLAFIASQDTKNAERIRALSESRLREYGASKQPAVSDTAHADELADAPAESEHEQGQSALTEIHIGPAESTITDTEPFVLRRPPLAQPHRSSFIAHPALAAFAAVIVLGIGASAANTFASAANATREAS